VTSNVSSVAGQLKDRIKEPSSRQRILLVIDDNQVDWSRYFRGRRLTGDYEIKVEQAEFRDLTILSHSEGGAVCGLIGFDPKSGRVVRPFRPDFVFVRQHLKNLSDDHRPLVMGLQFGGVPSINSVSSLYNFTDRPWVFSQLITIQEKMGKEAFPLIQQTFYPNYREMVSIICP